MPKSSRQWITLLAIVGCFAIAFFAWRSNGHWFEPIDDVAASAGTALVTVSQPETPVSLADGKAPLDSRSSSAQAASTSESAEPPQHPGAVPTQTSPVTDGELAPAADLQKLSLRQLRERAARGDKAAARELADSLLECGSTFDRGRRSASEAYSAFGSAAAYGESAALQLVYIGDARLAECRAMFGDPDPRLNRQAWWKEVMSAWRQAAAAGDVFAQIVAPLFETPGQPTEESSLRMQALAASYLDPNRPFTIADLADIVPGFSTAYYPEVWRLVACDLGYDCGAGGEMTRRSCLSGDVCTTLSYERHLLDTSAPRRWEILQAQRRDLLERLRSGNTRGIFGAPPAPWGG